MAKRIVVGIHISNRVTEVPRVQEIFTEFGCNIRTRLGLHQTSQFECSTAGLIILEMFGEEHQIHDMEKKLKSIEGISVKRMEFEE
jgi:hypothetical protein